MRIVVIIAILYFQVLANSDLVNITLKEYIIIVSKQQNMTILIDENVDHKITILIQKNIKKEIYLRVLSAALEKKNLKITYKNDYYIIQKLTNQDKEQVRFISLKYIKFEDIKSIFSFYKVKHEFIQISKTILISSNLEDYLIINSLISKFDKLPNQLKLKVTIIDTNLDNLREYGSNNEISISSSSNFFYNIIAYPFSVTNDIPITDNKKFYSFIKMINQKGISKLVSTPIVTLHDGKNTQFDVVNNIAYSVGEAIVNNETTKATKSFKYKDVGLKINIKPTIYDSDTVYLEFEMNVDNVINGGDTPTVSKKHIKQTFHMKKNKIFVLSGINRNEVLKSENGIPILKDMPLLGWLFKYKSNSQTSSTLSIILEIIDNNEMKKELDFNKKQKQLKVKKEVITKKINNYENKKKYLKSVKEKNMSEHQKRVKEILGL